LRLEDVCLWQVPILVKGRRGDRGLFKFTFFIDIVINLLRKLKLKIKQSQTWCTVPNSIEKILDSVNHSFAAENL